ncbi:MAG TPA: 50S ribosomal protein L21 [candidate division Zixibacteria bacterium]|nr:50S ribosomal protein L21 [candidate division Zixibacteria bacterium]
MYAIVDIKGEQVKVEAGKQAVVPHIADKNEGDEVLFDRVILLSGDGEPVVGQPTIEGASVQAKVVEHFRGDKVIVFKKKRRTGYHKKQGHRQDYTRLLIEEIATE